MRLNRTPDRAMRFLQSLQLTLMAFNALHVATHSLPHEHTERLILAPRLERAIPDIAASPSQPGNYLRRRFDIGISSPYYPPVAVIPTWQIILGVYAPIFTYFISSSLAAAAFVDFYLNILELVVTVWLESQPMNQIVLRYGNLRLEFGCSTEPVPWEFIKDFARSEADAVRRGFTTGWDKQYWHHKADQTRTCYVALALGLGESMVTPRSAT